MTKMSVDATSAQKKMWMQLHCKTGVNMASMQDKCCHGFMVKTIDVAMSQRQVLAQFQYKEKCWCSIITKTRANIASPVIASLHHEHQ